MLSAGKENSVTYKYQADQVNCTALVHAWGFGNISGECSSNQGQSNENNNGSGENNPNSEEVEDQGQQGPSQAELDAQKQEEEKKNAEEAQKLQATKSAVQAAREAFTSCKGCSKEEHDRLKEAWDNEKAKCKELYGNAVCGE